MKDYWWVVVCEELVDELGHSKMAGGGGSCNEPGQSLTS